MSQFEFVAQISAVKPAIAKAGQYGTSSEGYLEITLKVKQPTAPREPGIPWNLRKNGGAGDEIKPRPTAVNVKKDKDETVADHEARKAAALEGEQLEYDTALDHYQKSVNEWRQSVAQQSHKLLAYAQLIGLSSVFGGQDVQCVLTPIMQDLLPGFSASLMELPAGPTAAEPLFAEA